jgi:hypothetical protein
VVQLSKSNFPNLDEPEPKRLRASASKSLHEKQKIHRLGPNCSRWIAKSSDYGPDLAIQAKLNLGELFFWNSLNWTLLSPIHRALFDSPAIYRGADVVTPMHSFDSRPV